MITKISTVDMDREMWLSKRRGSIGGSDAAAVLGLDTFRSPYALWCEKTGRIVPEDIGDKEAVRLGLDLEQYVARRWMEQTGRKVRRDNHMIYNSRYPFAHANIDRAVVGESAGLECKTTSSFEVLSACREGKYPERWYTQMLHYMMVTGAEKWYLGVLVLGKGFYAFEVERHEDEIEALAKAESDFWQFVKEDKAPPMDGSESTREAVRALCPESEAGKTVDLSGVSRHLSLYMALRDQIKALEDELYTHQAQIMNYMGDAETGTFDRVRVQYKSQKRQIFDRKTYEAEHGKIPKGYFSESTSRPFKLSVRKR